MKDYEIALNPSRFDIIKSRLENSEKYENKYYLENMPTLPPPEPPQYEPSPMNNPASNSTNNKNADESSAIYAQATPRRSLKSDTDDNNANIDSLYAKCDPAKLKKNIEDV